MDGWNNLRAELERMANGTLGTEHTTRSMAGLMLLLHQGLSKEVNEEKIQLTAREQAIAAETARIDGLAEKCQAAIQLHNQARDEMIGKAQQFDGLAIIQTLQLAQQELRTLSDGLKDTDAAVQQAREAITNIDSSNTDFLLHVDRNNDRAREYAEQVGEDMEDKFGQLLEAVNGIQGVLGGPTGLISSLQAAESHLQGQCQGLGAVLDTLPQSHEIENIVKSQIDSVGPAYQALVQQVESVRWDMGTRIDNLPTAAEVSTVEQRLASKMDGLPGDAEIRKAIAEETASLCEQQHVVDSKVDGLPGRLEEVYTRLSSQLHGLPRDVDIRSAVTQGTALLVEKQQDMASQLRSLPTTIDETQNSLASKLDGLSGRVDQVQQEFGSKLDDLPSNAELRSAIVQGTAPLLDNQKGMASHLHNLPDRVDEMHQGLASKLDGLPGQAHVEAVVNHQDMISHQLLELDNLARFHVPEHLAALGSDLESIIDVAMTNWAGVSIHHTSKETSALATKAQVDQLVSLIKDGIQASLSKNDTIPILEEVKTTLRDDVASATAVQSLNPRLETMQATLDMIPNQQSVQELVKQAIADDRKKLLEDMSNMVSQGAQMFSDKDRQAYILEQRCEEQTEELQRIRNAQSQVQQRCEEQANELCHLRQAQVQAQAFQTRCEVQAKELRQLREAQTEQQALAQKALTDKDATIHRLQGELSGSIERCEALRKGHDVYMAQLMDVEAVADASEDKAQALEASLAERDAKIKQLETELSQTASTATAQEATPASRKRRRQEEEAEEEERQTEPEIPASSDISSLMHAAAGQCRGLRLVPQAQRTQSQYLPLHVITKVIPASAVKAESLVRFQREGTVGPWYCLKRVFEGRWTGAGHASHPTNNCSQHGKKCRLVSVREIEGVRMLDFYL